VDKWRDVKGHNLLQLMYEDPERWSLTFQTYVQLTMLEQHVRKEGHQVKMMERSIYSAKYCFVENLRKEGKMPASEYEVLTEWFNFLTTSKDIDLSVDLIIYLRTDPKKALERVNSRARAEEDGVPLSYLTDLHNLHEDWLVDQKLPLPAPVIIIDANKDFEEMQLEYVKNEEKIFEEMKKELLKEGLKNLAEKHEVAAAAN